MDKPQSFQARWKNVVVSGEGGTVPMLLLVGVFALAFLFVAVVLGEARGWWMLLYGGVSFAGFMSIAAYSIKREFDRLALVARPRESDG